MTVKKANPLNRMFNRIKARPDNGIKPSVNILNSPSQDNGTKSVAIIGSGVSGLSCAHYLMDAPHIKSVTMFEANDYIGGHVNTVEVAIAKDKRSARRIMGNDKRGGNRSIGNSVAKKAHKDIEYSAIDTGFIVFNERTYPNFFRLLNELKVPFQVTDMSFSVKNPALGFEYNGHTVNTLLSQRRNILRPRFWRFVKDILGFNKQMKALRQGYEKAKIENDTCSIQALTDQTLGDYLTQQNYGQLFTDNYLLPMVSAIWSMELEESKDFPLVFFAQFFDNHGLLDVVNRPRWFTIKGGSKQYVNQLIAQFKAKGGKININIPVQSVLRTQAGVKLVYQQAGESQSAEFDEVIFACHADTALRLLTDASEVETEVLSQFRFSDNQAILHTDTSILPKNPLAWASWNYLLPKQSGPSANKPILTYHMNILQRLTKKHNYLVTLNANINNQQVIKRINYTHPVYDHQMVKAQSRWADISGRQTQTHFCGAYWFSGFHEDGVRSALRVCQALGVDIEIKEQVDDQHLQGIEAPNMPFDINRLPVQADKNARRLSKRQVIELK